MKGLVDDRLIGILMRLCSESRGSEGRIKSKDFWVLGVDRLGGAEGTIAMGEDDKGASFVPRGRGGIVSRTIVC